MASSPNTSSQIDGGGGGEWTKWQSIFLGSKITAGGNCSHEIKRHLILGRKAVKNIDSVLKSRLTLLTNVYIVKDIVFIVVMYKCESWTINKADHQRIDASHHQGERLWWWERFLLSLGQQGRSKHSVLKEINSEYLLEWMMLKLKLQYFGYLVQRADSLKKTWILEKIEGRRRGDSRW